MFMSNSIRISVSVGFPHFRARIALLLALLDITLKYAGGLSSRQTERDKYDHALCVYTHNIANCAEDA